MKALYTLFIFSIPLFVFGQSPSSHTIIASVYMNFNPYELTITQGDTVYFENLITHNAVEVSEETYNNNGIQSNGGFELYSDDYVVFDEIGTHYYVCTPHVQMGMKGIINVNPSNNIIGQWYADIGDYIEITAELFTIYVFDEDCYDLEIYAYNLNENVLTLYDGGEEMNIEVISISPNSIILSFNQDTINLEPTSFDPELWVECGDESSWTCSQQSCFEVTSFQGEYNSLEECEANCPTIEESWNCLGDACTDPMDGSGMYQSLEECQANCTTIEESWNCVSDACTDPMDGSGMYQSLEECEANCSTTSISESNIQLNIYPNPSSDIFNLEYISDGETIISVTNVLGELVYLESTKLIGELNAQIDLSNYSKGVYNLKIKTLGKTNTHRLILQ